ncbi:MAG: hypothetical protein ABI175_12785 [Polyangiales bacterium]
MKHSSPRLRSSLRAARVPAILVAAYLVSRLAFGALSANEGLFSPGGSPRLGVVALGLVMLLLRLVVFFGLPAFVAYRIVAAVLEPRSG